MATAAMAYDSVQLAISHLDTPRRARDLRALVRQGLEAGDRHFVVDCAAWRQFDLTVLSLLIQCAAACREQGASFEVSNMSHELRADVRALQLNERLGLTH
jgi:anti-anti-sigma regulatory factor